MSLEGKLAQKTQELEEKKVEEQKSIQEKLLIPTYARIKELENQISQLKIVQGSLELASGQGGSQNKETGKGMKEYKTDTEGQIKEETGKLDTLIEKNKEVLQGMGVENREQLIVHPEFAGDKEAVSYKGAISEGVELQVADSLLKEKLATFGINIASENFSYDSAEKALAEKLKSLEDELLQEKLKTPEGEEKAIEALSSKEMVYLHNRGSIENNGQDTVLDFGNNQKIIIRGEKIEFKKWRDIQLIPSDIDILEKTYSSNILKEALTKARENEIESSFKDFDGNTKNIDKNPEKELERKNLKEKFLQIMETATEAQIKRGELIREMRAQNFGGGINDVEDEFSQIEKNKKNALALMTELTKIEAQFPAEDVIFTEVYNNPDSIQLRLKIPSVTKQLEQFVKDIKTEEQNLDSLREKISNIERKGPPFLGKDKWRKELNNLEQQREDWWDKIRKMKEEGTYELRDQESPWFYLPFYNSDILRILKEQKVGVQGNSKEIFSDLRNQLNEVINKKPPESVMKLYREYKDLEKKLS